MTTSKKTDEFRFVGTHVDDLADGRQLEPYGLYALTPSEQDDPHNKQRIDAGLLIATKPAKEGDS